MKLICDKKFHQIISHHRSAKSYYIFVTSTEDADKLLHGLSMTNETLYQTAHPSKQSLAKEAETMALWIQELEWADSSKVNERGDKLVHMTYWIAKFQQRNEMLIQFGITG